MDLRELAGDNNMVDSTKYIEFLQRSLDSMGGLKEDDRHIGHVADPLEPGPILCL